MGKRTVLVPVTWDSANRKKDRSVALRFTTNLEIPNADFATMDELVLSSGWLAFSENELTDEDIPTNDAPAREGKSKGSRFRSVCFLIWKKRGIDEAFEPWWDRQFERILDKLKAELD